MATFKNSNPKRTGTISDLDSDSQECGTLNLTPEDLLELKTLDAAAQKNKISRLGKNSRSLTAPYTSYTEEELVYIPIVFILLEDSATGMTLHKGKQFYIDVLETINSMLAGTYTVKSSDTLGPAKYHVDHGVECKIRYKLPNKLPVNYLKKFNYPLASTNLVGDIDFKSTTDSGVARFMYNDSELLNSLSVEASEAYETAKAALDLWDSENTRTQTNEREILFKAAEDAGFINDLGGLIDCGEDGAIFIRDMDKLKGATLSAYGYNAGDAVAGPQYHYDEVVHGSTYAMDYARFSQENDDMTAWLEGSQFYSQLVIPTAIVLNFAGEDRHIKSSYSGKSPFPTSNYLQAYNAQPNGVTIMNTTADVETYAFILLHEFGHMHALSHAFVGGYMHYTNEPDYINASVEFPLEGDAAVLNTLSNDDKLFAESRLNFAYDLVNGTSPNNPFMSVASILEDGDIVKVLPTGGSADVAPYDGQFWTGDGVVGAASLRYKETIMSLASQLGIFWSGSTSETEVNADGLPKLVINKTTYSTNIEGVDGSSSFIEDVSFANAPTAFYSISDDIIHFMNQNEFAQPAHYMSLSFEGMGYVVSLSFIFSVTYTATVHISDQDGVSIGSIAVNPSNGDSTYTLDILSINSLLDYDITGVRIALGGAPSTTTILTVSSVIALTELISTDLVVRAVEHTTKIPFCKLDAQGAMTTEYDEFWFSNGNAFNEDFPDYPANTPTDEMYDEFYCPCLHTAQVYKLPSGSYVSYTPIEDSDLMVDMFEDNYDTAKVHPTTGGKNYAYNSEFYKVVSYPIKKGLNWLSGNSKYGGWVVRKNGHSPIIGFSGTHPLNKIPLLIGSSQASQFEDNVYIQDAYSTDRIPDTAPQMMNLNEWSIMYPFRQKFLTGNSDVDSRYYNPYRLNGTDDEIANSIQGSTATSASNLIYNKEVFGHNIDYRSLYDPMQYMRPFRSPPTEQIPTSEITNFYTLIGASSGTLRYAFTPDQISTIEACVDERVGVCKRAMAFGDLIDLRNYVSTEDLFTPILNDIIDLVEGADLDHLIGCDDPSALNYNPEAPIGNYRDCKYAEGECVEDVVSIYVCSESSILSCNELPFSDYLQYFEEGATESEVLYSDEYPNFTGCSGGGYKYVIDDTTCVTGTLEVLDCLGVTTSHTSLSEELTFILANTIVEQTLICPNNAETTLSVYSGIYTFGGQYFMASGEVYIGVYSRNSLGEAWAGHMPSNLFRLYTEAQIKEAGKVYKDLGTDTRKFFKIKENIENICKFVKL